jgi:hypothetical protein
MTLKRTLYIFQFLIFSSLFLIIISCGKDEYPKSAGVPSREIRNLEAFKTINIYDCFNVYLKTDTINKIEIEAGSKLIPNIETSIKDGVLTIKDLNKFRFLKGYAEMNLYISVDTLSWVTVNDASKLYSMDTLKVQDLAVLFVSQVGFCDLTVNANTIDLEIWYGSGNYIVRGKSDYAMLYARTLSFIYADKLNTNSCYVLNSSMGDCYVSAKESIAVEINDSGNIYYTGKPGEINIIGHKGSGKLIKK